jgi:hypothetical protein
MAMKFSADQHTAWAQRLLAAAQETQDLLRRADLELRAKRFQNFGR